MDIINIICELFGLEKKNSAPTEEELLKLEEKKQERLQKEAEKKKLEIEKMSPAERLQKAKNEFMARKQKYINDTHDLFVAQDELHDQVRDLEKTIGNEERRYRNLLGLDSDDKPMLGYSRNSGDKKYRKAKPGCRWELSSYDDTYYEVKISEEDKANARNSIEAAEGYKLALENLKGAKVQIDEQCKACSKTIQQMGFIEQMYTSKMKVLDTQLKVANTLKSMAKFGTFDVDIDTQLKSIEDQVKHIQWDAHADIKIAQLCRGSSKPMGISLDTESAEKMNNLLKLTM
jgi:hypothetical protein